MKQNYSLKNFKSRTFLDAIICVSDLARLSWIVVKQTIAMTIYGKRKLPLMDKKSLWRFCQFISYRCLINPRINKTVSSFYQREHIEVSLPSFTSHHLVFGKRVFFTTGLTSQPTLTAISTNTTFELIVLEQMFFTLY